jgi:hypothetical protein
LKTKTHLKLIYSLPATRTTLCTFIKQNKSWR